MRLKEKGKRFIIICGRDNGKTRLLEEQVNQAVIYNKLADLEDIEDELGINFITLLKALKNGFRTKGDYFGYTSRDALHLVDLKNKRFYSPACSEGPEIKYLFEDYGKTWALTKEELKK